MLSSFGKSDVGRRRAHNEDSHLVGDRLFLVCDGMGGHQAGEVASQLAVKAISGFWDTSDDEDGVTWPQGLDPKLSRDGNVLKVAILMANAAIVKSGLANQEHYGMGTTVAAVLASPDGSRIEWATVGDSRIYRIRDGKLERLSRDDSWAEAVLGNDVDARVGGGAEDGAGDVSMGGAMDGAMDGAMKHALTKAVGLREELDFAVHGEDLRVGDTLVLCSDGLTNMVPDDKLLSIVVQHGEALSEAGTMLVDAANEAGGTDNITVVLVRRRR